MRILHVINNLEPAGAESLLTGICLGLADRGHSVQVATVYAHPSRTLSDTLTTHGITVHSLDSRRRYALSNRRAVAHTITGSACDIVHAHLFPAFYWTAFARTGTVPKVLTEHSPDNNRRRRWWLRPLEAAAYRSYARIVCISKAVQVSLQGSFPGLAEKMQTIHNGVDIARFASAEPVRRGDIGVPEGVPLITFVSRMYPPKDHATVLRALPLIPDAHLLLVGAGDEEPMLRRVAAELEVHERAHFLGVRDDVPGLLKASDICVHSSRYEGFCLVLVEAMACGVPVVASDIPASREVIGEAPCGEIFPVGDHEALAVVLQRLIANPERRGSMGQAGRSRCQAFSLDATIEAHEALYHQLIQGPRDRQ